MHYDIRQLDNGRLSYRSLINLPLHVPSSHLVILLLPHPIQVARLLYYYVATIVTPPTSATAATPAIAAIPSIPATFPTPVASATFDISSTSVTYSFYIRYIWVMHNIH